MAAQIFSVQLVTVILGKDECRNQILARVPLALRESSRK